MKSKLLTVCMTKRLGINKMENVFSYFPANVKDVRPAGTCTLNDLHRAIKNPKKEIRDIFLKIREADEINDVAEKQRLKEHLYYFTPAVKINNRRSYEGIEYFTGIMPLDFDKLDKSLVNDFKNYLFQTHSFIISCWVSASGRGVRALAKIPIVKTVDEFKLVFKALEYYEPDELRQYHGFDGITKNPTQPVFLSHDPDILIRDNAITYMRMYAEPQINNNYKPFKDPVNYDSAVEFIVKRSISKITNEGHWILRATAYMLGGYVAGGYIAESEAINLINSQILNHPYLSKKPDVYIKTAFTMIKKGQNEPLTLRDYGKR
jgi:hypothetical protein